jgi:hypothetical protein
MFYNSLFESKSLRIIQKKEEKKDFSTTHDDFGPHFLSSPFSFLFISTEGSPFSNLAQNSLAAGLIFFLFPGIFLAGPSHQAVRPSRPTRGLLLAPALPAAATALRHAAAPHASVCLPPVPSGKRKRCVIASSSFPP